jgi:hypothetical protein
MNDESQTLILKSKKILHLVLYSTEQETYKEMYKITSDYYKSFDYNVTTIFYTNDNTIQDEYMLQNNILLIKGEEKFSNITIKTLKAFNYFSKEIDNYEYIIRSNISTIINFKILLNNLKNNEILYGGGNIMVLNWLDPKSGVTDSSLFGLKFAQGTFIILKKQVFQLMMCRESEIRKDLVDDLTIALFIKNNVKTDVTKLNMLNVPNLNGEYSRIQDFIKNETTHIVAYRNNNRLRNKYETVDLIQMKHIIHILKNTEIGFYTCFFGGNNNVGKKYYNIENSKFDYYYFTNNLTLYDELKNTNWIRVYVNIPIYNDLTLDSFSSKKLKAQPNDYTELDNYKYLCYFDSKIKINEKRVLDHIQFMNNSNKFMLLPRHPFIPGSKGVFCEYNEAITHQKRYYVEKDKYLNYIHSQLNNGLKETTDIHYTTHYIIRKHCMETNKLNNCWYNHIKECGIECQISFFFIQQIFNDYLYTVGHLDGYSFL